MDIGRGFKAVFEDPQWVMKLGLALVFEILVVTAPAVIGFWMEYLRNVASGDDRLPEWGAFGTYWVRGLLVILAAIVYIIVGLLLLVVGVIPAMILFQAAVVEYAMTGEAGSLFSIKTVFRRIMNTTSFWLAWAVGLGLGVAINIVTSGFSSSDSSGARLLGSVIGAILGIYVAAVEFNLYGQYAREAYGLVPAPAQAVGGGYAPPPPPPPTPTGCPPSEPPPLPGPPGQQPPAPPAPPYGSE
ncbi:MAG TPA: DUF4013 domain-containing protein [Coriobacteriia bacterium]|jgi:hypothetical protein